MPESLQKIIARSGICSRREAEKLIREGKVKVNEKIVTEPGTRVEKSDIITVKGKRLTFSHEKFYYLFYKPRGCLASLYDPLGRKTVSNFLLSELKHKKVIIAGRLDYNHTGLIVLTNDGNFANYIMHPKYGVTRTYQIKLNAEINDTRLEKLSRKLKKVKKINSKWIEVTVPAGAERKIFFALTKAGLLYDKVLRTKIGNLTLGNLKPGEIRKINFKFRSSRAFS